MSYVRTTWSNGDTITAAKLNNIETGILGNESDISNLNTNLKGTVASTYDSTSTYAVGDYVFYNDVLYRCTTAITTAEAWTAGHWSAVKLADDVTGLKSALADFATPTASTNLLNPDEIVTGFYIRTNGTVGGGDTYAHTGYIPVTEGDNIILGDSGTIYEFRFVCAYDSSKAVVSGSGQEYGYSYVVPNGVSYIIISVTPQAKLTSDTSQINNSTTLLTYQAYGSTYTVNGLAANTAYREAMTDYPLTTLPEYMLNLLSYRPLAELSKGYICLVSDDGNALLNTYTIPMLIEKDVPATFALMSTSDVMQDASDIAIVTDAITNHGCSVAQHGGTNWTEYDEKELNDFFDSEDAFFENIGITVEGAVIPSHYTTRLISAIAGGRYGVVRSGYDGHVEAVTNYYTYYTSGARSNLFALSSFNVADLDTTTKIHNAVDYALENNKILIVYWHENSMDETDKATLEAVIDYAKTQELTFCTLGEIPYLL